MYIFFFQRDSPGDLMFSMAYLSSAERLTVVVMKARHLQPGDETKNTYSKYW